MSITNSLIVLAGIIMLFALYMMSRLSHAKTIEPSNRKMPFIKDDEGNKFSSVLNDIPARDGSTPKPLPKVTEDKSALVDTGKQKQKETLMTVENKAENEIKKELVKEETTQHILFISSKDNKGLDGNLIQSALITNGLSFGEMDIYHYFTDINSEIGAVKTSVFRVANGMEPWTLKQNNLEDKMLMGLSIIMITPTKIDPKNAMDLFISTTKQLCADINGVIKNQQQQVFTADDEKKLRNI